MPTYAFRDKTTGEVFEKFMSISAREEYLKTCLLYTSPSPRDRG